MKINKKTIIIIVSFIIVLSLIFVFGDTPKEDENGLALPVNYTQKEDTEADDVAIYVKENIKTIATNEPVLGGTWYTVSTLVDPSMDAGTVVYEDGHIQSTAQFTYTYNKGEIVVTSFNVTE